MDITTLAASRKYTDKKIMESGAVSTTQPDWNQNDETKPGYIKNRPFYIGDPVETVFIEETTVPFEATDGFYMAMLESTFMATPENTYKVSWDGTVYECVCVEFYSETSIGNTSIIDIGSNTGEPFLILVSNDEGILICTADISSSHTISISGMTVPVKKIDEKCLPDNLATKSEVEEVQAVATSAQATATSAQDIAISAQATATSVRDIAISAQNFAIYAQDVVDEALASASRARTAAENAQATADKAQIAAENAVGYVDGKVSDTEIFLNSSTPNSTKRFKITVDDSGNISATEVT